MTDKEKIVPLKHFYVGADAYCNIAVHEIAGNDWVEHADYAALESKIAAQAARIEQLTAESVALKEFIKNECYLRDRYAHELYAASSSMPETPATDAALREIQSTSRIEGINYCAAHVAAAFESGFIDKPESEVMDVVNMILISTEFIESADPSDFTGEYPRDVLKSYREFLSGEVQL